MLEPIVGGQSLEVSKWARPTFVSKGVLSLLFGGIFRFQPLVLGGGTNQVTLDLLGARENCEPNVLSPPNSWCLFMVMNSIGIPIRIQNHTKKQQTQVIGKMIPTHRKKHTHTHTPLKNLRIPIMINNYLNPNKSSDSGQFIISNLGNYKSLTWMIRPFWVGFPYFSLTKLGWPTVRYISDVSCKFPTQHNRQKITHWDPICRGERLITVHMSLVPKKGSESSPSYRLY